MTAEVAVMNKRGIALTADSAVQLGEGKKIYQTAEKLFSLSPSVPVAFMSFGDADMSFGNASAIDEAFVVPFAQRETIDMIIGGIHPTFVKKLIDDVDAGRLVSTRQRKDPRRDGS